MSKISPLQKQICKITGIDPSDVQAITRTAPERYKVFRIKKRTKGWRIIAQPAYELKVIQRALNEILLDNLPVHHCAVAYRRKLSIRDNALQHQGHTPILKMDFKDFFPSIMADDWEKYCNENEILDDADIAFTKQIFFMRPKQGRILRLSIGAPSSPSLSNILMCKFDEAVFLEAERRGITYTRYADDLTFSGQRIGMLKDMEQIVRRVARQQPYPRLRENKEKTNYITTAYRRTVTGLVLANDGQIGLGRKRRREISKAVFHVKKGQRDKDALAELCGTLAFVNVVEPAFLETLRKRYGAKFISRIQHAVFKGE